MVSPNSKPRHPKPHLCLFCPAISCWHLYLINTVSQVARSHCTCRFSPSWEQPGLGGQGLSLENIERANLNGAAKSEILSSIPRPSWRSPRTLQVVPTRLFKASFLNRRCTWAFNPLPSESFTLSWKALLLSFWALLSFNVLNELILLYLKTAARLLQKIN